MASLLILLTIVCVCGIIGTVIWFGLWALKGIILVVVIGILVVLATALGIYSAVKVFRN